MRTFELIDDKDVKLSYESNDFCEPELNMFYPYNTFYNQCKCCKEYIRFQGSGFICPCKSNVYELYNMCQCLTCTETTYFICNKQGQKISLCHPILQKHGLTRLKNKNFLHSKKTK
jgi:hypothetical protein